MQSQKNVQHFTYCYCYLSQDVLRDGFAFLDNLLVEFIQRRVHQLHTDPNIPLRAKKGETPKLLNSIVSEAFKNSNRHQFSPRRRSA